MDAARFQQLVELKAYVAGQARKAEALAARPGPAEARRLAVLEGERRQALAFLPLLEALIAEEAGT